MIQRVIISFYISEMICWYSRQYLPSSDSLQEALEEYFIQLKALIIFLLCNWMNGQIHTSKHTFKI